MAYNGVGGGGGTFLTTTTTTTEQQKNIKVNSFNKLQVAGDSGNDSFISPCSQDSVTIDDDLDGEIDLRRVFDGDVNSIFLCEFHSVEGPKITIQVPHDLVTKDLFSIVHQYIIPKVPLQGSFLSISMFGKKILGYPIRLQNESYARNAFYFNLCFVFQPTTRTIAYEPIVKKLTEHLISLEKSEKILSQIKVPEKRQRIWDILTRVRDDINRDRVCMLKEGCTTVPLCVVSHYKDDNLSIGAHQAPVLIENFNRYKSDQWDLTTTRILPFINGFNHIQRISQLAHMALDLVKECIKHLVVLEVCLLVPVFQYNNMYRPTPKLSLLAKCPKIQARCVAKCSLNKQRKCSVRDIFRMFASMAHGASFGEICVRFNPASLNINDRQMVLFGLVEGLIRIVNKYPVSVNTNCFAPPEDDDDEDIPAATVDQKPNIFNSFGGQDEIYPYSLINNDKSSKPIPRSGPELAKQRNLVQILKKFYNYYDNLQEAKQTNGGGGGGGGRGGGRTGSSMVGMGTAVNNNGDHLQSGKGGFFYTGNKSFDELSCAIGFSNHQLDDLLSRDKHCIVLFK